MLVCAQNCCPLNLIVLQVFLFVILVFTAVLDLLDPPPQFSLFFSLSLFRAQAEDMIENADMDEDQSKEFIEDLQVRFF